MPRLESPCSSRTSRERLWRFLHRSEYEQFSSIIPQGRIYTTKVEQRNLDAETLQFLRHALAKTHDTELGSTVSRCHHHRVLTQNSDNVADVTRLFLLHHLSCRLTGVEAALQI